MGEGREILIQMVLKQHRVSYGLRKVAKVDTVAHISLSSSSFGSSIQISPVDCFVFKILFFLPPQPKS